LARIGIGVRYVRHCQLCPSGSHSIAGVSIEAHALTDQKDLANIYIVSYVCNCCAGSKMDELIRAAKTLSDSARVRVLNLLMQRECCVCEVMYVLDISQVNASRYCTALKEAGFLKMRREGRWKHYRVDYDRCSPALRDILESVRKTASADPMLAEDIRVLGSRSRRAAGCMAPSCVSAG
jgi:ArsR family transcriptional regulator